MLYTQRFSEELVMNMLRRLPRSAVPIVTLFALSAVILAWMSGDSFGQQDTPAQTQTKRRNFRGQWNITGNLHVRVNIPGDTDPQKEFEGVTEVAFDDDWAVLSMVENDEKATLVLPRESLVYLKVWEVKEDGAAQKRARQ